MSYLSVIPLSRAKLYLRIDDDQIETDAEITDMIKGALSYIEKRTNHIFFPRNKAYYGEDSVNVYDFPINTVPEINTQLIYSTYSNVTTNSNTVILNVGYINPNDIPEEIIQSALQILKVWFFEGEKQTNTTLIPESVLMALDINRRFI